MMRAEKMSKQIYVEYNQRVFDDETEEYISVVTVSCGEKFIAIRADEMNRLELMQAVNKALVELQ
jgi:hypothetical protein